MTGVGTQLIFLKDLLDKFGVNVQLIRHGKYKSAGEMYIKNKPSDENLEQNQVMINSIWNNIADKICESRGITKDRLNALIDNLELCSPEDFLNASLVDELLTKEDLRDRLTALAVEDNYEDVNMIPFTDYFMVQLTQATPSAKKTSPRLCGR